MVVGLGEDPHPQAPADADRAEAASQSLASNPLRSSR
jgi:hypothetical protein